MKRTIAIVAAVILVTAAGVLALPWLLTPQLFGSHVQEAVGRATGHALSFSGGPRLTLWPEVSLTLRQVELKNPPGTFEGRFVTAEALRFEVSLGSLLRRSPEIEEIVVVRPVINLVVDETGRSNFTPRPTDAEAARPRDPQVLDDGADPDPVLPSISIVGGEVKYLNERSGKALALSKVDLAVSGSGPNGPLGVRGGFDWGHQRIAAALYIKSPARLTADGSPSDITLTSPLFSAAFNGRTTLKDGVELAGRLDFRTDSLADLAGSSDFAAALAPQLGAFSAAGAVDASSDAVRFMDAELALGTRQAEGDLAVSFKGARPKVTARLAIDRLDLAAGGAPGKQEATSPATGWSAEPVDLSSLKAVDGEISLTVAELAYGKIETGPSRLDFTLDSGRLEAKLAEMALYGGSASGFITVDASRPVPRFSATVAGRNLDGGKLIAAMTGFDRIEGEAELDLDVAAVGKSPRELIGMLKGSARLGLADGAVRGLDVPGLLSALEAGVVEDWTATDRDTPLSTLAANFAIRDGIAETEDVSLQGPAVQVAGAGDIDILRQRLDFSLLPQVRVGPDGGGADALREFPVPVVIEGLWSDLRIYPGIEGILDDPEKALKSLRQRIERHAVDLDLGPDKIEKALRKAGKLLGKADREAGDDFQRQPETPEATQ